MIIKPTDKIGDIKLVSSGIPGTPAEKYMLGTDKNCKLVWINYNNFKRRY